MPTQWSEAEQVPLGCIAPPFTGTLSDSERADVGIGPYRDTPQPRTPPRAMPAAGFVASLLFLQYRLDLGKILRKIDPLLPLRRG